MINNNVLRPLLILLGAAALLGLPTACVRRTIKITTEPTAALVYLNDQEIGRSEATIAFLWYGDYDVVIRKEGYETLSTNWVITEPWYQMVPLDFFTEVLWPGEIHDVRTQHFVLEKQKLPTHEELLERAEKARMDALSTAE